MSEEKSMKTGTTTIGIKCKDGVILAADKRATAGNMIVNPKMDKVFIIEDSMAITTAGTVSEVQLLLKLAKAELRLKRMRSSQPASVNDAANLLSGMVYSAIRKMSMIQGIAHFLFAGSDDTGEHLYDIYPDGSITETEDFVASGSGSVFAYGVLETLYDPNMTMKEARKVAIKAINVAIKKDSASGNGIDVVEIGNKKAEKVHTECISPVLKI